MSIRTDLEAELRQAWQRLYVREGEGRHYYVVTKDSFRSLAAVLDAMLDIPGMGLEPEPPTCSYCRTHRDVIVVMSPTRREGVSGYECRRCGTRPG